MLSTLRIKNLAIIDDITLEFGEGLNILTGETGAGKSIIIDALGLAMGTRASVELIRTGTEAATVEVQIDLNEPPDFLLETGIDCHEGVVIRRTVSSSGKSRAYLNASIVNNQVLASIAGTIVDIHGQFSHQSLLLPDRQLDMLDAFAGLHESRSEVESLYRQLGRLKRRLHELEAKERERASKEELLTYQIQEIEAAALRTGEEEELTQEYEILSNVSRLMELGHDAHEALYAQEESSCLTRLAQVLKAVSEIAQTDPRASETLNTLSEAEAILQDAAYFIRDYKDSLDFNPQRLEEVQDRLEQISRLKKKYGRQTTEILELKVMQKQNLRNFNLWHKKSKKSIEKSKKARKHSAKRQQKKKAVEIQTLVEKELSTLAMGNTQFSIAFYHDKGEDTPGGLKGYPTGIDRVEYLIAPNVGEELKPLARITSGGELSRIMLALKSILSQTGGTPILVFDEIDTGVGGKTAEALGEKLKQLAHDHQVICITHLPQIAVFGDRHMKIEKMIKDERTTVQIRNLTGREREEEIARMLSGKITEASIKHARELIDGAVQKA